MKYLLFGGESDSVAKGADSFLGSFESVESARDYLATIRERDPLSFLDWAQVAAWDGGTLTILMEAGREVVEIGNDGSPFCDWVWHETVRT